MKNKVKSDKANKLLPKAMTTFYPTVLSIFQPDIVFKKVLRMLHSKLIKSGSSKFRIAIFQICKY